MADFFLNFTPQFVLDKYFFHLLPCRMASTRVFLPDNTSNSVFLVSFPVPGFAWANKKESRSQKQNVLNYILKILCH